MSEERLAELEKQLTMLGKIVAVGWALLVAAFGIGVWVTTLEFRTRANGDTVNVLMRDNKEIMNWKIEAAANRFTIQDYLRAAQPMQDALVLNDKRIQEVMTVSDKRIQRVEDAILNINKSLDRIEATIGSKK